MKRLIPFNVSHQLATQWILCQAALAPALTVGCLLIGCGGEPPADPDRAIVSGTVTFDGKPLPAGTITFESTTKPVGTSVKIRAEGKYTTDRAPIGTSRVSIDTESIRYGNPAAYVAIPSKYADTATSGLTVEIKPGDNEGVDFQLTR